MGREGGGDSKGASGYRGAADQMVRPTIAVGLRSGPWMAFLKLRSRKKASKDPPRRLRTRRDVGAGKHERREEGSGERLRLAAGGCLSWRAGSSDESNKRGGDQCRLLRDALLVLKVTSLRRTNYGQHEHALEERWIDDLAPKRDITLTSPHHC
ncbi:hypothetical protein EV126DRAFT_426297 [Verticillium dahliae]|nr:hypothetical protein EV126DRAFT_426297 [Verticillium dahliae]